MMASSKVLVVAQALVNRFGSGSSGVAEKRADIMGAAGDDHGHRLWSKIARAAEKLDRTRKLP
jgi:hypothetical protein